MGDSLQKWVGRNRPPRVQITYDVEIGDAVEKKELPFVMGILADLAGHPLGSQTASTDARFWPHRQPALGRPLVYFRYGGGLQIVCH